MSLLKKHFTKKNLTNPKWYILLIFVMLVLTLLLPLALTGFITDVLDSTFDKIHRVIDRNLTRYARKLEDWANK